MAVSCHLRALCFIIITFQGVVQALLAGRVSVCIPMQHSRIVKAATHVVSLYNNAATITLLWCGMSLDVPACRHHHRHCDNCCYCLLCHGELHLLMLLKKS